MNVSTSVAVHEENELPRIEVTPRQTVRVWFSPEAFLFTAMDVDAAAWLRNLASVAAAAAIEIETGERVPA